MNASSPDQQTRRPPRRTIGYARILSQVRCDAGFWRPRQARPRAAGMTVAQLGPAWRMGCLGLCGLRVWPGVRRAGLPRQSPPLTPGQWRRRRRLDPVRLNSATQWLPKLPQLSGHDTRDRAVMSDASRTARPPGCKLSARRCSWPNDAAWCLCGCLPRTAVARMGCCTSLLYGTTAVSDNTVKIVLTSAREAVCGYLLIPESERLAGGRILSRISQGSPHRASSPYLR